jgi:hypothetical protein
MAFVPMDLMMMRVKKFGAGSDIALFHELLYAGEFIVKMTTAAVVAAILDDRTRQRYGLIHALVRASGVGDWASKLDEALTGPASQHLTDIAKEDRRVFNDRVGHGTRYGNMKRHANYATCCAVSIRPHSRMATK